MSMSPVGTAVARKPAKSGSRARYRVLALTGHGHATRALVSYQGHAHTSGRPDPVTTGTASTSPIWVTASRLLIHFTSNGDN